MRDELGLPERPFLYTLDQVATLLSVNVDHLKLTLIYWKNRSVGYHKKDMLMAVNIAPVGKRPDWRIAEEELIRWMRFKRLRIY